MALPERLTLNGKRWRVRLVKGLAKRDGVAGWCCYDIRTIKIDADLPEREKRLTLVHEVLHSVWPDGIVGGRTEERLIEKLEEAVHGAFKVRR